MAERIDLEPLRRAARSRGRLIDGPDEAVVFQEHEGGVEVVSPPGMALKALPALALRELPDSPPLDPSQDLPGFGPASPTE